MTDQTHHIPKGWKMTTLGEIPSSWHISTAEKFCLKVADGTHATPKPVLNGRYLVTSKHIKSGKVDLSSAYQISQDDFDEVNKRSKVDRWDVIFSMIGTVGEIALIDKEPSFAIKNVGLFKCGHEHKAKWLFYFLRGKIGQGEIQRRMNGTTQSYVTLGDLRSFPVIIPSSTDELKAIVAVLSSLDDKIELLREQNKTLEATAQAIFKEWFVRFNFPDKDGKPYKASGGKMIDSELGEIPEGWRIFALSELVGIVNGYSYKGSELKEKGHQALVTLKSFDRNGGFQIRGFKPFDGNPKTEQEVSLGDLVIAHTDLTQDAEVLGNPAFIFDNGGYKKMYITMDLVKICSKNANIALDFYYYLMSTSSFKKHCIGYSNGTTVLHLSKRAIPEYKIALSDDLSIVMEFSKIAQATTKKLINNFSQIQTLSKLRDTLLPKLMKGEVRVRGNLNI